MATPAELLTGLRLDGGWTVTGRTAVSALSTGGFFSVGYLVEGTSSDDSLSFVGDPSTLAGS